MTSKKVPVTEALLEAQVAFMAEQLGGEALRDIVEQEVDAALAIAGKLRLHELVSRVSARRTVRRLLAELAPGDAFASFVVDLAVALYTDKANDHTTPGDLVDDALIERGVDQGLSMSRLREALIRGVIASPAYHAFASDLLYQGIRGYLAQNAVTRNIPGAQSVMKLGRAALSKATPRLESAIEEGIKKYIAQAVKLTSESSVELLLSPDATGDLRRTALELWRGIRKHRIGSFRREIAEHDVRQGVALAHELWTAVRGSDYVAALVDTAIDAVFERYDDVPLQQLLSEVGITRELLVEEILRHAAPALKHLRKKKMLEPMLRRRLSAFYEAPATLALLEQYGKV
jgi:hypothetical protein